MSILSQIESNENEVIDCVERFFSKHHIGKLLSKCNGTKEKGIPAISILRYKLGNIFTSGSMYMQQRTGAFKESFSKNTFYRFLNSGKTNWLRFTSLLSASIINEEIKPLTDEKRVNTFIIDDSLFNRSSCKKTELGSKVFDHTDMSYKKGYRMLTLGWSDGNTFLPINSCLLASSKDSNIIGPVNSFDKRTIAGKRRILAQKKAT
ncbi:MAG: transposase, partial [Eubacteriales bacterium]|nr:transposase [Eubacteriales bacterium]